MVKGSAFGVAVFSPALWIHQRHSHREDDSRELIFRSLVRPRIRWLRMNGSPVPHSCRRAYEQYATQLHSSI